MTAHTEPSVPPLARGELDRRAEERATHGLLEEAMADASAQVLVVVGDTAPLASADGLALRYVPPTQVSEGAQWAFLGRHDDGAPVLLAAFPKDAPLTVDAPHGWGSLRTVGGGLNAHDAGVFVEALSLGRWLIEAPFCSACGAHAEIVKAGWARRCPSCGREHFPRTDPAVIVAVTNAGGDHLLLGSNALWGAGRYSCFAGFVEAGEALEATVVREVREEAGVRVVDIDYRGSQAWPYPRSLMVGFRAVAVDAAEAEADGEEIVHVRWFTREEIAEALAGGGEFSLPGPASIARSLIADWQASPA